MLVAVGFPLKPDGGAPYRSVVSSQRLGLPSCCLRASSPFWIQKTSYASEPRHAAAGSESITPKLRTLTLTVDRSGPGLTLTTLYATCPTVDPVGALLLP